MFCRSFIKMRPKSLIIFLVSHEIALQSNFINPWNFNEVLHLAYNRARKWTRNVHGQVAKLSDTVYQYNMVYFTF